MDHACDVFEHRLAAAVSDEPVVRERDAKGAFRWRRRACGDRFAGGIGERDRASSRPPSRSPEHIDGCLSFSDDSRCAEQWGLRV